MYLQNRHTDMETRLTVAKEKGKGERDGQGVWGWEMQTIKFRMDKQQQDPTVWHKETISNFLE